MTFLIVLGIAACAFLVLTAVVEAWNRSEREGMARTCPATGCDCRGTGR